MEDKKLAYKTIKGKRRKLRLLAKDRPCKVGFCKFKAMPKTDTCLNHVSGNRPNAALANSYRRNKNSGNGSKSNGGVESQHSKG